MLENYISRAGFGPVSMNGVGSHGNCHCALAVLSAPRSLGSLKRVPPHLRSFGQLKYGTIEPCKNNRNNPGAASSAPTFTPPSFVDFCYAGLHSLKWILCFFLFLSVVPASCLQGRPGLASGTSEPRLKLEAQRRFGDVWLKTELYFGLSKVHGGCVSESEWNNFLDGEITPLFKEGLTVLSGEGQYLLRRSPILIKEQAKVVILIHPVNPEYEKSIDLIIQRYREKFDQESVLRVTTFIRAKF